jgi:hypothetical protein
LRHDAIRWDDCIQKGLTDDDDDPEILIDDFGDAIVGLQKLSANENVSVRQELMTMMPCCCCWLLLLAGCCCLLGVAECWVLKRMN